MNHLWLLGALAAMLIVVVVVVMGFRRAEDGPGQRLLAHSRDRSDYRMFVGMPPARPTHWAEVARLNARSIRLRDAREVKPAEVTAYFVTYPGGQLFDFHGGEDLPLPTWVHGLVRTGPAEQDTLTEADVKAGQSLVRVTFGRSTADPNSRDRYSTTLTNVSRKPVRVLKFAGYTKSGSAFALNTVTGQFFTAADFKEWYGQRGEWIAPGQSVTDPNNYGSPPVLWAYYCEAQGGERFVTGAVVE